MKEFATCLHDARELAASQIKTCTTFFRVGHFHNLVKSCNVTICAAVR